jgi:hypothetical protein
MTDDEMKDFYTNQLERQKEWKELFKQQKARQKKEENVLLRDIRRESMRKYKARLKEERLNN